MNKNINLHYVRHLKIMRVFEIIKSKLCTHTAFEIASDVKFDLLVIQFEAVYILKDEEVS